MGKLIDLTGQRFGKLTVLKRAENQGKHTKWLCLCDCGRLTTQRVDSIREGRVVSCGCVGKQKRIEACTKHQKCDCRIYRILAGMKDRCYNPKSTRYKNYGGRGIEVCEEWQHNFQAFYNWTMANGYSDDLTIDRIDVNGNYEPSNCRWVTCKVQADNTTRTIKIFYNNHEYTLKEFCLTFGVPYEKTYSRLKRLNWDIERILNTP